MEVRGAETSNRSKLSKGAHGNAFFSGLLIADGKVFDRETLSVVAGQKVRVNPLPSRWARLRAIPSLVSASGSYSIKKVP